MIPVASPLTDQLQGWGTAIGALIAAGALVAAMVAYRAQSRQLRHQQKQIADQQELNRQQSEVLALQARDLGESLAERRRAQAVRVFMYASHSRGVDDQDRWTFSATLKNASDYPIRGIVVRWHRGTAAWGEPMESPWLPPGAPAAQFSREMDRREGGDLTPAAIGAVIEFRDAAGVRWRITPSGGLEELAQVHAGL
ncbi:hypothetical protein [Rugosimonospora africana]|uniref:Uncharacterized protein n=1 Tax=Rugosimonospora africana TaxID=556532 RepID=A0A8J3R3R7_9ACTN|nr:hypothetical protein [Rugosimonospora africana]GIH21352.1 hypothetical protein Raf01_95240 [Rugosimonospora africana]